MENWGQVFSGIAALALLVSGGAGCVSACFHRGRARESTAQREEPPSMAKALGWVWRAGILVSAGALAVSVILRTAAAGTTAPTSGWLPLSSVGDRAAVVALVASLLSVGAKWQKLVRPSKSPTGWAGPVLIAVVAGIGALSWPEEDVSAPFLLLCTLGAAGLAVWAAGQDLDVVTVGADTLQRSFIVALAGLTASVLLVGGVNGRFWGAPGGLTADAADSPGGFLNLLAIGLIGAASLVLHARAARFAIVLELIYAVLLVVVALNVQWALPFS